MKASLLQIQNLTITFGTISPREVVSGLTLSVKQGETVALVGESGSGKSVTALAVMGLLPDKHAMIRTGTIAFEGQNLIDIDAASFRKLRGPAMGMIFQEPMTSLNPVLTIGRQLTEGLQQHSGLKGAAATALAIEMLDHVGIPDPAGQMARYPHEFSGGMRQRVMIASVMIMRPRLVIADEPTTALDVTVQAQIMELMRKVVRDTDASLLLITHDMGVVAQNADRVVVMKAGRSVEDGDTKSIFLKPRDTYTKALLAAVPRLTDHGVVAPEGFGKAPALKLSNISKTFGRAPMFGLSAPPKALDDVSLTLPMGTTMALVGESGSGKSTLGRIACRLIGSDFGEIEVEGETITHLSGRDLRHARSKIQMIFQDPFASLDPRFSIGRTLAEPLTIKGMAIHSISAEVARLLDMVRLPAAAKDRFPHQFSGGQRQRIAIARALAASPSVIVADEPTSALDVSIQAEILTLLQDIQRERGISYLFITHDLAVVAKIASCVAVMKAGVIVEHGKTSKILQTPRHPYTQRLIASVPVPDPLQRQISRPYAETAFSKGHMQMIDLDHWVMA